jgi:hypothetical protein
MELVIKISEKDLVNSPAIIDVLKTLAVEISKNGSPAAPSAPVIHSAAPVNQTMTPAVMLSSVPTAQAITPPVMQNPVTLQQMQTPVMQNPIPTAAPTAQPAVYTLEQLSLAAAPLMDAGKTDVLVALMQSLGVQTLQQLPQERYNDFAVAIRGMGAQI